MSDASSSFLEQPVATAHARTRVLWSTCCHCACSHTCSLVNLLPLRMLAHVFFGQSVATAHVRTRVLWSSCCHCACSHTCSLVNLSPQGSHICIYTVGRLPLQCMHSLRCDELIVKFDETDWRVAFIVHFEFTETRKSVDNKTTYLVSGKRILSSPLLLE